MPFKLIPVLLALATSAVSAQTLSWSVQPRGVAISADAAENVFTVDWDANPAGDITLTKTAPNGVALFSVRYDNTDPTRNEQATWVQVDGAGGAYVSGNVRAGSVSNPVVINGLLMRFAADGALRWRVLLGVDGQSTSTFRVLRDAADNAYVLGIGPTPAGVRTRIQKVTPEGAVSLLWYDTEGIGAPVAFKWGRNGDLVLATRATTGTLGGAARVSTTGLTLALSTMVPALASVDAAVDAEGNLYVASIDPSNQQGRLMRIGASFGTWVRQDAAAFERVEAAPDGSVVVGAMPNTGTFGVVFLKYAADGSLLWANRDADGPDMLLSHGQMRLDTAGNVYLAASDLFQMAVTRGNADGTTGWTVKAPFGGAVALDFGVQSQAVYAVGGQTARIDQGGGPPPSPDLTLTLADAPDPVRLNTNLTLTTVVRNTGTAPAAGVTLQQGQSATVVLVQASTTQGSCTLAQPTVCTLGTLAPGASVTVTQVVRPRKVGSLVTSATTATTSAEPDTADNTTSATTTVRRR